MQINLINGYYIEIDEYNYTLKQKYEGKTKDEQPKECEKVCGYFNKLDGAVDKFIKLNQIDNMAKLSLDLREYVKTVNELNKSAVNDITSVLERVQSKA